MDIVWKNPDKLGEIPENLEIIGVQKNWGKLVKFEKNHEHISNFSQTYLQIPMLSSLVTSRSYYGVIFESVSESKDDRVAD